jgi:hypothetical protein
MTYLLDKRLLTVLKFVSKRKKSFYRNTEKLTLEVWETLTVASPGHDIGIVTLTGGW